MRSLARIDWKALTSSQKHDRNLALEVLRLMRKGISLTSASREAGISRNLAKNNLGRVISKRNRRYVASLTDTIQRSMEFYDTKRGRIFVTLRNSKDASKVGKYLSSVNKAINGDSSDLKKFRGKYIIDADGKKHYFETRLERVFDIKEGIEQPEFEPIYDDGEEA